MKTDNMQSIAGLDAIADLIRRTRRTLRSARALTGAALAGGIFLALLLLAVLLDLLAPLSIGLRVAAAALIALPTVVVVAAGVIRPLTARLRAAGIARRIEACLPRMHNRLLTCVDLMRGDTAAAHSAAFHLRVVRETLDRVRAFQPVQIVNVRALRRAAALVAIAAALCALVWARLPYRAPAALARLFKPLADLPPASDVSFAVTPGSARLLRGDDIPFAARVLRGRPDSMRLEVSGAGRHLWYEMKPALSNEWTFTLTGFETSFDYRIHGGGTWSRRQRIELLDRPAIKDLQAQVLYPAYMGIAEPQPVTAPGMEVTGPQDSTVEVLVKAEGPVARGAIQMVQPLDGAVTNLAALDQVKIVAASPLQRRADGRWRGCFPLVGEGYYRVTLLNALGHPNKPMQPVRYLAYADQPPQVILERPAADLTLSASNSLPLVISVYDDFGLAQVALDLHYGPTNACRSQLITNYPAPPRNDSILTVLDLAAFQLKPGESLRYKVRAVDRKEQPAESKEYAVRIAPDNSAENQRYARFEQEQDAFLRKLVELAASQSNVTFNLGKIEAAYAPVIARIGQAVSNAEVRLDTMPELVGPDELGTQALNRLPWIALDPETSNRLAALRRELELLAAEQDRMLGTAQQAAADMQHSAEQAAASQLIPVEFADQLRAAGLAFEQGVLWPMRAMAEGLRLPAAAAAVPGDMEQVAATAAALQHDLALLPFQLAGLTNAARNVRLDSAAAMAQLADQLTQLRASLATTEMRDLHGFLGDMGGDLGHLETRQENLLAKAGKIAEDDAEALAKKQARLEQQIAPLLAETTLLQSKDAIKKIRRPEFPMAPYVPDSDAYRIPQAEEDTDEPLTPSEAAAAVAAAGAGPKDGEKKKDEGKEEEEEEEPLFMPALGGETPKLDPRLADSRPAPVKYAKPGDGQSEKPQSELQSRQWQRLKELDLARQSVVADQQALAALQQQLEGTLADLQAKAGGQEHAGGAEQSEAAQQRLRNFMNSSEFQQAMTMANRMDQIRRQRNAYESTPYGQGAANRGGSRVWGPSSVGEIASDLPLDPAARQVILKMQPVLREEILQGMREEGPEGYRAFIRDYFRKLTTEK